jgi:hypothetical protein
MSINQLNYKAPEKSEATEELAGYMVHRRAQYREFPDGLSECEITQIGIAACSHILSVLS